MIAVRDDEIAAATSGVAVVRTKVLAFVVASALAATSGALYAHYAHYVSPQDFDLARSVTILVMLIAGGEMSVAGAVVGALLLSFAPEWLRFVGDAYLAVFGVGVLLILILVPEGLAGLARKLTQRTDGASRDAPDGGLRLGGRVLGRGPGRGAGSVAGSVAGPALGARPLSPLRRPAGGRRDRSRRAGRPRPRADRPERRRQEHDGEPASRRAAPVGGTIRLGERDLGGLPAHAVARAGLARTFQNGRLFTRLSVLENVLVGADARFATGFVASLLRTPRFRREEEALRGRAIALLDELGLADDADRAVRELPYGGQRKIEIARALILAPRVLMLDEPAAGLNSGEVEDLIAFVSALRAGGLSILLIEHNMGLVMRLADRIAVLNFGRLIADGSPAEVRADERVVEAYLGRRKTPVAAC